MVAPLELTIDRIVAGGKGLGFVRGQAVFVPWTAPGDRVRVRVIEEKKGFLEAVPEAILEPGPHRQEPPCPVYGQCGGCQMLHLDAVGARAAKEGMLVDALRRIGKLEKEIDPWLPTTMEKGYRCRASLKVRWLENKAAVGFYQPASHRLVDIPTCMMLHPSLQELPERLRRLLPELTVRDRLPQVDLYASETGVGLVFHLLDPITPADRACLLALAQEQDLAQLWLQYGRKDGMVPLLERRPLQYTPEEGLSLVFVPGDFTQVNLAENRLLVAAAMAMAGSGEGADGGGVMDLFCGLGNFTLPLARRWSRVLGVEGYAPALLRATANARAHGLAHITWQEADLFRPRPALPRSGMRLALLDPPREGAGAVCKFLAAAGSDLEQILYVSCNPATLARDAAILFHGGWHLAEVRPLEMFPGSHHLEVLARFHTKAHS